MQNRKLFHSSKTFILFLLCISLFTTVFAEDSISDLKRQIEALQKKVDKLEATTHYKKDANNLFSIFHKKQKSWDPFEEINRMHEEMDRMFKDSFYFGGDLSKGMFRSDLYYDDNFHLQDKKDRYIIEFDMTGLDQSKIDIEVNENNITIKSERSAEETEKAKNKSLSKISYASFLTTIPTPVDADTSRMKTEKKGNKFIMTLPKKKTKN